MGDALSVTGCSRSGPRTTSRLISAPMVSIAQVAEERRSVRKKDKRPRALCPWCVRNIRTRKDGRLRRHTPSRDTRYVCPGSGALIERPVKAGEEQCKKIS